MDETIAYWKQHDFWGEVKRGQVLSVPRTLTVAINKSWKQEAQQVPVADKKELFYRAMLPLILTANEHIEGDRSRLQSLSKRHHAGEALNADERVWLRQLAGQYRVIDSKKAAPSDADILASLDKLLLRVDIVPPGLALGQRAKLRAAGKPLTTLALVGTLSKYSERGQAYVKTLTGIIKTNKLDVADDARLRDEPVLLMVGTEDVADKAAVEKEIARLRASGEIDALVESMQLEPLH